MNHNLITRFFPFDAKTAGNPQTGEFDFFVKRLPALPAQKVSLQSEVFQGTDIFSEIFIFIHPPDGKS